MSLLCVCVLLLAWFYFGVLDAVISSKPIFCFSVCGMLSFTVSVIAVTATRIVAGEHGFRFTEHYVLSMVYSSAWCLGQIFVYLLFIQRLKHSFNRTKYQITRRVVVSLYAGIAVFAVISFVFQITHILRQTNVIHEYLLVHSGDVRDVLQLVCDLALSFGFLYLLNNKLNMLTYDLSIFSEERIQHRYRNANEMANDEAEDKRRKQRTMTLNARQQRTVRIAARLTVLSSVFIICTQSLMIFTTAVYELWYHTDIMNHYQRFFIVQPIADILWEIGMTFIHSLFFFCF